jgi:hypothetical protein
MRAASKENTSEHKCLQKTEASTLISYSNQTDTTAGGDKARNMAGLISFPTVRSKGSTGVETPIDDPLLHTS